MRLVAVWVFAALVGMLTACDEDSGFGFRNLGKRAASSVGDQGGTPRR